MCFKELDGVVQPTVLTVGLWASGLDGSDMDTL